MPSWTKRHQEGKGGQRSGQHLQQNSLFGYCQFNLYQSRSNPQQIVIKSRLDIKVEVRLKTVLPHMQTYTLCLCSFSPVQTRNLTALYHIFVITILPYSCSLLQHWRLPAQSHLTGPTQRNTDVFNKRFMFEYINLCYRL